MHLQLSKQPLIDRDALHARVGELAAEVDAHYGDREILVLVVLKGSAPFSVDLMRQLNVSLAVEYIRAKSYDGAETSGEVIFSYLPEEPLRDRHVLIVEDILDTGHTAAFILDFASAQHPATLKLATLLDKPTRRLKPVDADFVGFTIEDHFVVGYGLDYNERFRELDAIYTLES